MTPEHLAELYDTSIVIDAAAPISPHSAISLRGGPPAAVRPYVAAGTTCAVFTIVDDYPNSLEYTVRLLGQNIRYFSREPEKYVLVDCASDVARAKREGKLAVAFAFQGTNALQGDIAMVGIYRKLGVIQMLLAYNVGNLAADGCHEQRNAPLTAFGRALIHEMNRFGVIVDLSHTGVRSSLEAMDISACPVIFSHSTPDRFSDHQRNITDEQIRGCGSRAGLVCLSGVGLFMDGVEGRATSRKLAETIDYVVQMIGAECAGIGLDYVAEPATMAGYITENPELYGGGSQYPADGQIEFLGPELIPDVVMELDKRGYSEGDIKGILGGNYLRILDGQVAL
jgi:membrane dipeptidase